MCASRRSTTHGTAPRPRRRVGALVAARTHAARRHRLRVLPRARALLVRRPAVVGAQMREIRSAGIEEIVSRGGAGSPEDSRLRGRSSRGPRATGINVAVHLEPYPGRTRREHVADIAYLRALGIRTFYVYRAVRPARRRLGRRSRDSMPGHPAVRADGARRRRGRGPLRRHLHVRHRHSRRQHVRAALQRGARAAPALRAVGRPRVRRAARRPATSA